MRVLWMDHVLCYVYVAEEAGAVHECLPRKQVRGCVAAHGCLVGWRFDIRRTCSGVLLDARYRRLFVDMLSWMDEHRRSDGLVALRCVGCWLLVGG